MNFDQKLKLQALLDGELSEREATVMRAVLEADAEARALYAELESTRELLAGNDVEMKVPESREFYWSKIARQIEAEGRVAERQRYPVLARWWLKVLAPVGAAAALAALLVTSEQGGKAGVPDHIETSLNMSGGFSFYSPEERMTVVWVESGGKYQFTSSGTADNVD